MVEHLDNLALYVRGELAPTDMAAVESHVRQCSSCAAELARAARLELALVELAASSDRAPLRHRGSSFPSYALPSAILAAGCMLLLLYLRPMATDSASLPKRTKAQGAEAMPVTAPEPVPHTGTDIV